MKRQILRAFGAAIVTLQIAACVGKVDVARVDEDGGTGDGDVQGTSSGGSSGLARFTFIVNGVGQLPLTCPSANWEFPPPPDTATPGFPDGALSEYVCASPHMCPGITSVVIENTGQVSVAYIAQSTWNLPNHYEPGVPTGEPDQLVGVLAPGARVDITSVFVGEITALLGSSEPFSPPGKNVSDEGTIPWPAGVAGSGGAQFMSLAEINMYTACGNGGSLL